MVFDDTYRTIEAISNYVYKEKSSKFIAFAIPANSEVEVNEQLKAFKKNYHDANHHCYAYRLGFDKDIYRFNDDGEPSGTAGKQIYGQLLSYDLTNVLVLVIRYFGGTKLGVSGLISAYKTATKEVLGCSIIISKVMMEVFDLSFEYSKMNIVMKAMKNLNIKILGSSVDENCQLRVAVRKSNSCLMLEQIKRVDSLKFNYIQTI